MKKTLTILLTLCLLLTMMPITASAASTEVASGTHSDNITWVLTKDGTLTISGEGDVARGSYASDYPWYPYEAQIKKVIFEEGVTNVPEAAFSFSYPNLTSVELNSVEIIDYSAFNSCTALTTVSLPETLKEIRNNAFAYTALEAADIPEGVTLIGSTAFTETKLTEIILPEGLLELGDGVFSRCTELKTAYVPDSVTYIGMNLFANCTALETANIPANMASVPDMMFDGCSSLKEIEIPDGITTIGMTNFRGTALTAVTIPASVTFMGSPFMDCMSLTEIIFEGDVPRIGGDCFQNVTATAYYPRNNPTWTADVMQNYGGTITWEPYGIECTEHTYESVVTEPTCTEQGCTTYTCTNCGYSYVDDYADPVDHVYVDGYCQWCGKGEQYVKFSTYTTSLGGNIAMNFYVELSEDLLADPNAYMQFTFAGRTTKVPLSQGVESQKNGVTVYMYACPITSKNMSDEITAQVVNASGNVGESKTMAVDTYCNWIIANYKDEKTINLMKAMLNYGASAQMLFDHNTDDLANAALAEEDKILTAVDASAYIHSRTGEEEGIKASSYTLLLDSETTVRCYFELTGDKTIDEFTFTVDGVEVEPQYKDGRYYIEKKNIAAHRLDDMHVFTCGGITIKYGGLSYVNQVMTYYKSGTTFDMAVALYNYSQAAEAYLGTSDTTNPAAELKINGTEKTIGVGDTYQIDYTYTGDVSKLTWSSSNPDVAAVDQEGVVTALAEGSTTIKVTDGTNTKRFKIFSEVLAIIGSTPTLTVGDTYQLDFVYVGDKSDLLWTSTNNAVATVNQQGLVTAEWNGNATIKVTDGTRTAQLHVSVEGGVVPEVTDIVIASTNAPFYDGVTKYAGDYTSVTVRNVPEHSTRNVTVTSSNSSVVSVSMSNASGAYDFFTLDFKSAGSATITITSADGAVSQSYTINVEDGYDFDPGEGLLTPADFAYYTTQVMCADGFTETYCGSWRLLTLTADQLTFSKAISVGRSCIHSWWPNGCRYAQIVYVGQDENGNYQFHTCWG